MKKTIAILLVLVIGMVGVFAADISNTLTVSASVTPINMMGIYAYGGTPPTDNSSPWSTTHTYSETITTAEVTNVATLHTRSNNRGGYVVTMKASPLSSIVAGSETTYLGYSITAFSGTTTYGTSTVASYDDEAEGNVVDIITVDDILGNIVTQSRNLRVVIADIASAPAGTYTGNITFEFSAN